MRIQAAEELTENHGQKHLFLTYVQILRINLKEIHDKRSGELLIQLRI